MLVSRDVRCTVHFEQSIPLAFTWEPRIPCYMSTAISACPYLQFKPHVIVSVCRGRIRVWDAVDSLHHGANSRATQESFTWRQMTWQMVSMIHSWYLYVINTISRTCGVYFKLWRVHSLTDVQTSRARVVGLILHKLVIIMQYITFIMCMKLFSRI